MNKFYNYTNRTQIPIYAKMKPAPEGSHLVKYKKEKEYDYYICDNCGKEIRILKEKYKMTGGIVTVPPSLTKKTEIKLALCNKCLKEVIEVFSNGG